MSNTTACGYLLAALERARLSALLEWRDAPDVAKEVDAAIAKARDGCDSCARLAESWEAMREALISLLKPFDMFMTAGTVKRLRLTTTWDGADVDKARAALALAAKVKA